MLDIKRFREIPDLVKAGLRQKNADASVVDVAIDLDERIRSLKTDTERLRAEQKNRSKDFGRIKKEGGDIEALQRELNELKERITGGENALTVAEADLQQLMDRIPNLPHPSVPVGKDASENEVVKESGTPRRIDSPKPHWEIAEKFGMALEVGARISGAGFPLLIGPAARLERALRDFFMDVQTDTHGYTEVSVPLVVREPALYGTGYLPKLAGEQYHAERDEVFLIPTAEVPLTSIHADEILDEADLPKRYIAYTPCWRREAGAAGSDTRGMVRVHQFYKAEMMMVASPKQSYELHEELTGHAEALLEALELPYRRLLLCSGDMSFAAAKCYDLEVYSSGVDRWLEVSSCSNFESFQARRLKIRYRDAESGRNEFCHTLNGSGLAVPRVMVALIENGLMADGNVRLPKVLHSYYGREIL